MQSLELGIAEAQDAHSLELWVEELLFPRLSSPLLSDARFRAFRAQTKNVSTIDEDFVRSSSYLGNRGKGVNPWVVSQFHQDLTSPYSPLFPIPDCEPVSRVDRIVIGNDALVGIRIIAFS